ncbi:C45 family autoproteolytic acyltransferase/hydrolase [Planctomycetota bacterium]
MMNNGKNVFLLTFFSVLLLLGLPKPMLAQVSTDSTEEVLPPGILPVVILQGSDYEMGYQYGQQAGGYIEKNKEAAWAQGLESFDRAEVISTLKANQHFIKEYTPELIDQLRGMADGATAAGYEMSYTDILLLNCTLPNPETSTYPVGAEKDALPIKKCSVCSAWGSATKDGRLIGMDTLDSGESLYGVIIVVFPDKGNNYICGAQAGEIGDHFLMNNKGFFLGNSGGGGSPRPEDNNYGICWSCSLPYIVRFADNALEARDMIMKWQINVPENFHFVDVHGNAFVVEKTAAIQSVRKPGDFGERDFLYSTNTYLNAIMKVTKDSEFVKQHGGFGAYASPRNMMLWDMLHNYHGQVDVEFMKMMLRFPGDPPPYPPAGGWDAKICRPSNGWVSVLIPDDGDEGVANICTGPAGKVIHSSMSSDGSKMRTNYPFIDGTHTFFKLKLAADPKAMVKAAKRQAKDNIATAYSVLMRLNYDDTGYAALNEIYSQANIEYYQGGSVLNKAILADGNEAIKYFAEAATAFTQSQAHAMQVFEALVPPATSPSDLGLKPFGGDWARWETAVGTIK